MRLLKIILLCSLAACGDHQNNCLPYLSNATDQYDFPVKPGSPEWQNFTTGQQKIDACQVPDPILKAMSTNGIIESCLSYPLLNNMFAYTSVQEGTEAQIQNFNGFGELELRDDASALMLSRYRKMNPDCHPSPQSGISMGDYGLGFIEFNMIQAQPQFLGKLSTSEKKELLIEAISKYNKFSADQNNYGIFNIKASAYIMAKVMISEGYQPFVLEVDNNAYLRVFVKDAELSGHLETLKIVYDHAKKF